MGDKKIYPDGLSWVFKKWFSPPALLFGLSVWSDGKNIFTSQREIQKVLNKETLTWSDKKWYGDIYDYFGQNMIIGHYIWTDGDDIYCSPGIEWINGSTRYVHFILNKSNSTWTEIRWSGDSSRFSGDSVWTDGENIYHSEYGYSGSSDKSYIFDKNRKTWSRIIFEGSDHISGSFIWNDGEHIYHSIGPTSNGYDDYTHFIFNKSTKAWSRVEFNNITDFHGDDVWSDGDSYYLYRQESDSSNKIYAIYYKLNKSSRTWVEFSKKEISYTAGTYDGLHINSFDTDYIQIWSDDENVYYSKGNSLEQYILDKEKYIFKPIDWLGLSFNNNTYCDCFPIQGCDVWTDNTNIYYSYYTSSDPNTGDYHPLTQYILDKDNNAWRHVEWNNFTPQYGRYIWCYNDDVYYLGQSSDYSGTTYQKILDKRTNSWVDRDWYAYIVKDGKETEETYKIIIDATCIWTDGNEVYYSNGSTQKVLDKETSTWESKTWSGLSSFSGTKIWIYKSQVYYSNGSGKQKILNKATSTWEDKEWAETDHIDGYYVWSDGQHMHCSMGKEQYVLIS